MSFFRLRKDLDYPVYLKVDLSGFEEGLRDFIFTSGFELMEGISEDGILDLLGQASHSRILSITLASNNVMRHVDQAQESDLYGFESLVPREGYSVYRYKREGIIVYSSSASIWKLGCRSNFGEMSGEIKAYKIILNRFLSWALAPMGVVGFWGRYSNSELELLKQSDSDGELVFLDMYRNIGFNSKTFWALGPEFRMVKSGRTGSSTLKEGHVIPQEEFISILSMNCSFFDYKGLGLPIRQMIQRISKIYTCRISLTSEKLPIRDLSI
jgi:hypothetical protein